MDPLCFDVDPEPDPDPAKNLYVDPDPDPDPGVGGVGGGRSAKNVHPPWQNPIGTPLAHSIERFLNVEAQFF